MSRGKIAPRVTAELRNIPTTKVSGFAAIWGREMEREARAVMAVARLAIRDYPPAMCEGFDVRAGVCRCQFHRAVARLSRASAPKRKEQPRRSR